MLVLCPQIDNKLPMNMTNLLVSTTVLSRYYLINLLFNVFHWHLTKAFGQREKIILSLQSLEHV